MRLFGSPAGTRMRLSSRKRGGYSAPVKDKPKAVPYTPEELRAMVKPAPKAKPLFVSRVLTFLRRKVV